MKDLPHVFRGEVKEINNSNMNYTTASEKQIKKEPKYEKTINQKLNEIFSSTTYVYKKEVVIKTENGTVTKQIVGRNKDNIMTLDNEVIPINTIIDIYPK